MSNVTRATWLVAAAIGLGALAGCASERRTTIRERETVTEPRIREERTVIVPQEPSFHEETSVIRKERREVEEED
jgi:hypothetical protein